MELHEFQTHNQFAFSNGDLLQQALTHRSYVNEHDATDLIDNERLEFLGDAIIDFVAGEMLFQRFPDETEGDLTRMRAALVRTESLADLAKICHIGDALRMGKGEDATGGRERVNNLCGAFEAVIGALYLDAGMDAVKRFALPLLEHLLELVLAEALDKDARSLLQEWSQAEFNVTPVYRIASEVGPDHAKLFTVEVLLGENVAGSGTGRSKQSAAQAAARDALRNK